MTKTHLRRRSRRAASALFAATVAGGAMVATTTTVAAADEEAPLEVQTFAAADFASAADDLPAGLSDAVERDLGVSAEEYLANAAAAKQAVSVVDSLKADGVAVVDAKIDGQDLTIYVEGEADVEVAAATGAKVEVGAPEDVPDGFGETAPLFEDNRGGQPYVWTDPEGNVLSGCSSGFNGVDAGGNPVVYTAGHCGFDGGNDWQPFPSDTIWHKRIVDGPLYGGWWDEEPVLEQAGGYGVYAFGEGSQGHDGGYNTVTEEGAVPPEVLTWGGGSGGPDSSDPLKIYDAIKPMTGQEVCKSGGTTGWTCGEILQGEYENELSTGQTVVSLLMNACMQGGDSGGATVVGNYAVGVDSWGSTLPDDVFNYCEEWDPYQADGSGQHASGSYALVGNSKNLADLVGDDFNLSISVGAPSVENPGAEASTKPTFSGTAQAAEGAVVTLHLSGPDSRTLEATVGADGKWSVQPNEALPTGDYTYTASTSHTANGASNATTSEEVSGSFSATKPPVEELTVSTPKNDQTVESGNQRPTFEGTGHPGAEIALAANSAAKGTTTVDDDGNWSLTPNEDLPAGTRFDATVTQTAEGDEQIVTVTGLGIKVQDVAITNPEAGAEVTGDIVFTGTAHPNAEIGLLLQPKDASSNAPTAAAGPAPADEDDVDTWEGEFEMDKKGNWTFTPAEPVALGDYTVTASSKGPGDDEKLSTSTHAVDFTVVEGDGDGDDDGDDDGLPDTGTNTASFIILGAGLLAAGSAFIGFRLFRHRRMTA